MGACHILVHTERRVKGSWSTRRKEDSKVGTGNGKVIPVFSYVIKHHAMKIYGGVEV
jgi:hypothetical protein